MRIRKLQLISVLAPLAALLCVGALGYWIASGAKQKAILFRQETLQALDYSADLNSYQAEGFGRLMLQIETDDPVRREAYHTEGVAFRDKIDQILKTYGTTISPDQAEARRAFDNFVQTREQYRQIGRRILDLVNSGQKDEARKLTDSALIDAYKNYTKAGDVLFDYEIAAGDQRSRDIEWACTKAQLLTACFCVVIFLAGILTPFILIRLGPAGLSEEHPN